jgi:bifunctional N-acetylglucosamine-1-phosphate-uridyltransferase/glucosamine-1-phosphate-acetyltransferase GlmU-like protein
MEGNRKLAVVLMAAGNGTRLKSQWSKVAGRPGLNKLKTWVPQVSILRP